VQPHAPIKAAATKHERDTCSGECGPGTAGVRRDREICARMNLSNLDQPAQSQRTRRETRGDADTPKRRTQPRAFELSGDEGATE
jgi:hypothetical protein